MESNRETGKVDAFSTNCEYPARILNAIEAVDDAIRSSGDVNVVLENVIAKVLEVFRCDRAWLFHPCNPEISSFSVKFESTTPAYPGAKAMREPVPMTPDMAQYCRRSLAQPGRPFCDPAAGQTITNDIALKFEAQSLMLMTLKPQTGDAWMFGVHQCDHVRMWEEHGKDLFTIIGSRITDCLSNMLYLDQLRESEAQKAAILNGITTNLAFVNENLEILWANKAAADSVGKTMSQLVGHKCHKFWADPENPCENCPTVKAFKTKKTENLIIRTPDGRVWDEKGEPVFDEKGELLGVLEIAHDITEKTRAKEALEKAVLWQKEVVKAGNVGLWDWDVTKNKVNYSPEWKKQIGYDKHEIGEDLEEWRSRVHPDDLESTLKTVDIAIAEKGKRHQAELRSCHKDGSYRWILAQATTIADDETGTIRMLGCNFDITEMKEMRRTLIYSPTCRCSDVFPVKIGTHSQFDNKSFQTHSGIPLKCSNSFEVPLNFC